MSTLMMTAYIVDPIAKLLSLVPPIGSARVVVGLVGLPGAGKSTQAKIWTDRVNEHAQAAVMQTVGMDGFHLSLTELAQLPPPHNDLARRGAPWTFNFRKLARSLVELHQRDIHDNYPDVRWPDFDHAVGEAVPNAIHIEPSTRLILVEGLYLLLNEPEWNLKNLFDHVWFLDEDIEAAIQRLIIRHCQSWGITEADAIARIEVNDKLNADIADQTRCYAQALVAPIDIHNAIFREENI
jgi:pantothenate kinase